jgi:hypothetical protein
LKRACVKVVPSVAAIPPGFHKEGLLQLTKMFHHREPGKLAEAAAQFSGGSWLFSEQG